MHYLNRVINALRLRKEKSDGPAVCSCGLHNVTRINAAHAKWCALAG